jgi:hypothetical protein
MSRIPNQLKFRKGYTRTAHLCAGRGRDPRLVWPFVRLRWCNAKDKTTILETSTQIPRKQNQRTIRQKAVPENRQGIE